MNLDDALRYLLLRLLRDERVAAGEPRAAKLADLATRMTVARDKESRCYKVAITGSPLAWEIPDSDFVFYQRGDRKTSAEVSFSHEDAQYDKNLANARKWIAIFEKAHES